MHKRTYLLITILSIILPVMTANTAFAAPRQGELVAKAKRQPLPKKEIKRFVSAIAVIKHYYIHKVSDNKLFSNAIRGMVSRLDPHSSFLDENDLRELRTTISGKFVGIGVELTSENGALRVISPLEGTPAFRAGIKANDLIIKIDGKLVQNMTLTEAVKHIKGPKGTKVSLTIIRKGDKSPRVLSITRDIVKLVTVKKKMLENGFGYVRITFFQGPVDKSLRKYIRQLKAQANGKLKGFILDLRSNPGGLLDVSAKVADTFLDPNRTKKYKNLIVYTEGRIKGSDVRLKASPSDMIPGVPLVVLINGGSASASEIVAGALQDYKRAIIMGSRSFGKGSVQTILPIGDNSAIKLTTALYVTPAGRVIQAQGIMPDVTVPDLKVSEKNIKGLIDLDESDYRNHLNNKSTTKRDVAKIKQLKEQRKKELALAKDDYQMYEALMMLKGMHAVQYRN